MTPAGVRFRAAGPGDAAGLVALTRALDQETRFMVPGPGGRTEGPGDVAAGLDQVARAGNSVVVVAESAGQLAGYAEARGGRSARNRATAHVVIGVLAAARGRGVGTGLLGELTRCAPAHGIRRLELTVMAHNQRAKDLCQRMGCTVEGRRRECHAVGGRLAGELYMGLLLPAPAR
jgi:L-amino acid N-acyltransferase YncA